MLQNEKNCKLVKLAENRDSFEDEFHNNYGFFKIIIPSLTLFFSSTSGAYFKQTVLLSYLNCMHTFFVAGSLGRTEPF